MNAKGLRFEDGVIWFFLCSKCGVTHRLEENANKCCTCSYCGEYAQYNGPCDKCSPIQKGKNEHLRFEKANKIQAGEWDSWVYLEGVGYNEGYFPSIEDFKEYWEENQYDENSETEELLPLPKYVWATEKDNFALLDANRILESACEEGWEDCNEDDLNGTKELRDAVDKFNEANKEVCSYNPDFKTAILL